MTVTVNIAEAKTQLSRIIDETLNGRRVIIARRGTPLVELTPITAPGERELGFLPGTLPDSFFDPLPEAELQAWSL